VITREASRDAQGQARPRMEFRGEFLHAFLDTERVKSHKPVELTRGTDRFTADSLEYDNLDQVVELRGRVRGVLMPGSQR
jgi:lipopolysaccharide export system protein LptC